MIPRMIMHDSCGTHDSSIIFYASLDISFSSLSCAAVVQVEPNRYLRMRPQGQCCLFSAVAVRAVISDLYFELRSSCHVSVKPVWIFIVSSPLLMDVLFAATRQEKIICWSVCTHDWKAVCLFVARVALPE